MKHIYNVSQLGKIANKKESDNILTVYMDIIGENCFRYPSIFVKRLNIMVFTQHSHGGKIKDKCLLHHKITGDIMCLLLSAVE